MKFYHYNRCGKSREALNELKLKGVEPEIREYFEDPITPDEMSDILEKLGMEPEDLIRKDEKIWKEEFADKELARDEQMLAMIEHPRLMQRPIFINGEKAVVGRPPEKVLEILD